MKMRIRIQWPTMYTAALALVLFPFVVARAQPASRPADNGGVQAVPAPQEVPDQVVVDVNGETMTEKMVTEAATNRLRDMTRGRPIPPQQAQMLLPRIRAQVIEQFVTLALLKTEAAALNVVAEKADVDAAIADISEQLPPGLTLEEALKRQGMTEAALRDEIRDSATIRKLVELKVPDDIAVSDEEIAGYFAENRERMATPASVQARHILLKVDAAGGEDEKAAARAEAEGVRKRLIAGEDFAALANAKSACPSGKRGGDLGKFVRGQMVPPFEKAAFTQKIGEIGPLVETSFGYHIIQVVSREDAKTPTLAEVHDRIEETLSDQKRAAKIEMYVERLRKKAKITRSTDAPAG
jgi:peptidyl-prolyl cis-trans isomerase C